MAYTINSQTIRRHIVDWRYAALALLTGLSQGTVILSFYWTLCDSFGATFGTFISTAICILLFGATGAWWWGRASDGESSLAPQTFALTLILSALYWSFWPWLIEASLQVEQIFYPWAHTHSLFQMTAARAIAFSIILGPGVFFCGGSLPLLSEAALSHKGLHRFNMPLIGGLWALGLLLAASINFLEISKSHLLWGGLAAMFISAVLAFVVAKKDNGSLSLGFSLVPTSSIGLWKDSSMNVLHHDLSSLTARFIWLVTLLTGFSCCGLIIFWSEKLGLLCSPFSQEQLLKILMFISAAAIAGILIIASQASKLGRLPVVLAVVSFITAVTLSLAPKLVMQYWNHDSMTPLILFTFFVIALMTSLWPLIGQVFQLHRGWLGSSLGIATFWMLMGILLSLILTSWTILPANRLAFIFNCGAIAATTLAFYPLLGRLLGMMSWVGAIAICFFWLLPQYSQNIKSIENLNLLDEHMAVIHYEAAKLPLTKEDNLIKIALLADAFLETNQPGSRNLVPIVAGERFGTILPFLTGFKRRVITVAPGKYFCPDNKATKQFEIKDDLVHFLHMTKENYPLIISGPLDGTRQSSNQMSADFYNLCRTRLNNSGTLMQIIFPGQLNADTAVQEQVEKASTVFPYVSVWKINSDLLVMIASLNWNENEMSTFNDSIRRWNEGGVDDKLLDHAHELNGCFVSILK